MEVTVYVDCEREEGLHVSKDLLAEELDCNWIGEWIGTRSGAGATVTKVSYEGSVRGKSMKFTVGLQLDEELDELDLDFSLIQDGLEQEWDGLELSVDAPNDTESQYSVCYISVVRYEEPPTPQVEEK